MLKGLSMGIAEVIPGVSGGTLAFITGIYERLLEDIKNVLSTKSINALRKGGVKEFWSVIDGGFLLPLLVGMAAGVVFGVFTITHLLETKPTLVWGFFFGLILASVVLFLGKINKWNASIVISLVAGTAIALWISMTTPAHGTDALWFVFVAGMVAITALILPGISGSFMLLLMGMYTLIVPNVKEALSTLNPDSLKILVIFAAGCVVGLALFSRVVSAAFKKYPQVTMALLTGFMLGSLYKIWPWRNVASYRTNSHGEQVPFIEKNIWPSVYEGDPLLVGTILSLLLGIGVVYGIYKYDQKMPHGAE